MSKIFYQLAPFRKFRNAGLAFAKELHNQVAVGIKCFQAGDHAVFIGEVLDGAFEVPGEVLWWVAAAFLLLRSFGLL